MMYEDESETESDNNDYVINDDEGNDYALVRIEKRPRRRNSDFYLRAPKKRSGFSSNGNDWWGYQDLLMSHWPRVGEGQKEGEESERERKFRMMQEAKKAEELVK